MSDTLFPWSGIIVKISNKNIPAYVITTQQKYRRKKKKPLSEWDFHEDRNRGLHIVDHDNTPATDESEVRGQSSGGDDWQNE